MSTRIVKKSLTISKSIKEGRALFRGKASALVNAPSRRMPTMQELKASALDSGLKDKVVLITGASRGVGEITAKLFGLLGAKVIVNYYRGAEDAARIVSEIQAEGGDAVAAPADVARPDEVKLAGSTGGREVRDDSHTRQQRRARLPADPLLNLTWDEIQRISTWSARARSCAASTSFRSCWRKGEGKIINISSVAVDNPPADQTKYVMAKSALVGLTRSLSVEYAARNIQVNLVVPNFVETDLVAHIPDGFRRKIARDTPMQRLASPIEVAQAVVFLASSSSSFTTGQKIMVTGWGSTIPVMSLTTLRSTLSACVSERHKRAIKSKVNEAKKRFADALLGYDGAKLKARLRSAGVSESDTLLVHSNFKPDSGFQGTRSIWPTPSSSWSGARAIC